MGVDAGVKKVVFVVDVIIVWCQCQCFGASVTLKQSSSLLSMDTFKTKSNSKHFLSSRMAPKRAITYLYSSKYYLNYYKIFVTSTLILKLSICLIFICFNRNFIIIIIFHRHHIWFNLRFATKD